ncbi:hypothetical protein [Clostridium saccharobutylicum]|uniref:DUF4268 domain-containing protein n=2 Tax=Clostridium saccharobutylicum TaxID=169679 RepID=U5MWD1_CLOSA|nr:hypothetical protein [Clostridium saccharobutylicum]AGX43921.1 hypothetical protein CLSA_c29540 [Clostridium saccharobutylicum DSM 13864]AQR91219.1 hypothetical protein CLOSC_29430 [Clostridium saccharobutylicum]AQS01123.1 hypothetical protein CSACC_29500 [Clostridium saccharobutylicum]AQS15106.1 hypothetical protein CLOSACC_29500 [Clostridium saccharobutylicum]MBA8789805.1 putative transcriptional regulator [Clostridium saccharobutylicum]
MGQRNSRKKELILNLYCKLYPQKLNKILRTNLSSIMLERDFDKRRIDITAISDDGKKCYIEVLLKKTDDIHYEQVKTIIERVINPQMDNLIVWIAPEFNQKHIQELFKLVASNYSCRNLELKIIRLNGEAVIPILEDINKASILEQVEKYNQIESIEDLFFFSNEIKCSGNTDNISFHGKDRYVEYTRKQNLLIKVIERLREDFWMNPNVHQYKDVENGNYISMGSGISSGIEYRVVINKSNSMGVEVCFGYDYKNIFYKLLSESKEDIEESLDFVHLVWNSKHEKIGWYLGNTFMYEEDLLIKRLARITKQYICIMDKYIRQAI